MGDIGPMIFVIDWLTTFNDCSLIMRMSDQRLTP